MQHQNKHTCSICLKNQIKHLEHTLATYVYSYCNMCNISIYFCYIDIKHLQHTSETLETYVCNMLFQRKHLLAASQMEARRRVEDTDVLTSNAGLDGDTQKAV